MDFCKVDISKFLMPWEHSVCSACLQRNPHSVWLVKRRCFEPHQHGRTEQTIVTIDHSCMEMVTIRPLPHYHQQFQGEFVECQHYPNCRRGTLCNFAHSKAECDTWNIKKRILKGGTVATEFKIKCTVKVQYFCQCTHNPKHMWSCSKRTVLILYNPDAVLNSEIISNDLLPGQVSSIYHL